MASFEVAMSASDVEGEPLGHRSAGTREDGRSTLARFPAQTASASVVSDPELEWIRKIASGDRSAFEHLFHAYHKRIFGYLYRLVGQREAAEELMNDVMVSAWKGAAGFKGESKVSTWIFGIAHFRGISFLRRTNPNAVEIDEAGPLVDSRALQEDTMVRESTRDEVRRALARLSPQHRAVVELTFYQEFSYPEIASILSCPVNTVKTRMFYAKKELRDLLSEGAHS